MTRFPHRHLLGIEPLAAEELTWLLDQSESFLEIAQRPVKKVPSLRGRTIVNLFFEASTRTRTSFEIAGKRLSADVVNFSTSSSSVTKGETLLDTARNIAAMAPDAVVVRHGASGVPELLARALDGPAVINAGDGAREHPTQALLDCLTIRQHKRDFGGLKVAIVGDIARSRVARSDIHALRRLGARVHVAGPPTLLPAECASLGVTVHHRIEPALDGADVVIMLRIQMERGSESGSPFPTLREYSRTWGLNARNLRLCAPDAIVMHPGPLNRGVEIAPDVADGERSVILDQVENGVAVRMAVLFILASARE